MKPLLDCSPIPEIQINEEALKTLACYFYSANPNDIDEQIVSLRTGLHKGENDEVARVKTLWWTGRFIGVANIKCDKKNIEISIKPRFGESFLLTLVEDIYNIKIFNNDAEITENKDNKWFSNLLNILRLKIWVEKCALANKYGLPRRNTKCEHRGITLRGAINTNKTMLPWLMKKEVVTNTYEKVLDDSICKILYEAHKILTKNIKQNSVKGTRNTNDKKLQFSQHSTPPRVQDVINTLESNFKGKLFNIKESDYNNIKYKSIYQSWKPLVDLSWSIIKEKHLGNKASLSQSNCLFVDMAEIWESFLRKKLAEGLSEDGWRLWNSSECKIPVYNASFFSTHIIPDIVLHRISNIDGKDEFLVFDAKYKRMKAEKYDIDRSDLFQIHTYIHYFQHKYPDSRVLLGGLLYPLFASDDFSGNCSFNLYGSEGLFSTKFMVDGVVCDDFKVENKDTRVNEMIERIKRYIGN